MPVKTGAKNIDCWNAPEYPQWRKGSFFYAMRSKETIKRRWRHGDDTAAAEVLKRRDGLKFRPQCLRYFRLCDTAYPEHTETIIRAYRTVQRRRGRIN